MKNKKPSKQTAIPTKNESNKGDSKGRKSMKEKVTIDRDRYEDLLLSEEALKDLMSYKWSSKWVNHNTDNEKRQIDITKSDKQFKTYPGWQKGAIDCWLPITKILSKSSIEEQVKNLKAKRGRKKGTDKVIEESEKRYKVAKEIFKILESKGEILPIKRSQIENVIFPLWGKRTTIEAPKAKTLFSFQDRYINEDSKG